MELINRMTVNKLKTEYAPILAASDSLLITGRYFFYNKQMGLYCHDLNGDSLDMLRFIIDEESSDDIELILRTGGLKSPNGISLFTRPIYNPVFVLIINYICFRLRNKRPSFTTMLASLLPNIR